MKKIYILYFFLISLSVSAMAIAGGLVGMPFSGDYRLSSPFGGPRDCNECSVYHPAVDYATPMGTPILSTTQGTVTRVVSSNSGYGNFVTVCSSSGNYCTQYSHLSGSSVSVGQTISPGMQVGSSGDSGAGGIHLDYKVMVIDPDTGAAVPVDPLLAQGKDLDDPNVRRQLIADSEAKLNGRKEATVGGGTQGSGGGDSSTNPVPPEDSAEFEGALIGCEPAVKEGAQDRVDALKQQEIEAAKAIITQPTPVEQLTCLDQHTEVINAAGGIHSKPGGNISDTVGPLVQQPLQNTLQQFMNGNIAGSIMSTINNAFANVTQQFQSMLGGLGGGLGGGGISAPNTNCDMQQQAWLISQCIEMPTLPSLGDILGGKIGEALGKVNELGQLIQSPERMLQKVCDKANSKLQDTLGSYMSDLEGSFDKAADSSTKPVFDSIDVLGN